MDGRPFSTEFSHTRFLVPHLMNYKGWALFLDSDMIFLSDIKKLWELRDDSKAVMCFKHQHRPDTSKLKMDGQQQTAYHRKNWSSFIMFNCGHKANSWLTPERVNMLPGSDLHAMSWLRDDEIGDLPNGYNYISGVSPPLPPERGGRPYVIHYTHGGPWFAECQDVAYGQFWLDEYEDTQRNGMGLICDVPSIKYEALERVK